MPRVSDGCEAEVFNRYNHFDNGKCGKTVKVIRDGVAYCGLHDPVRLGLRQVCRDLDNVASEQARVRDGALYARQTNKERQALTEELLDRVRQLVAVGQVMDAALIAKYHEIRDIDQTVQVELDARLSQLQQEQTRLEKQRDQFQAILASD